MIRMPTRYRNWAQKYLLLQLEALSRPEGYEVLSVREVTGLFAELRQTAVWFFGIYLAVFLIAGLFIYMMMREDCGTDGEATGGGRETGAAHGGTFP